MIDSFALLVSHGLIALAVWRLASRPDLDDDGADSEAPKGFARARQATKKDAPGA